MSVTVTGELHDVRNAFQRQLGDIVLYYRDKDFGRVKLPGFHVEVKDSRFKNRSFNSLPAALKYVQKLHDRRLRSK